MPVRGSIVKRCVYFGLHSPRCHYQLPTPHSQTLPHTSSTHAHTHTQTGDFRTMKLNCAEQMSSDLFPITFVTGMSGLASATIAALHSNAHQTCTDIPREGFQSKLRPTQPLNKVKWSGRGRSKWMKVGRNPECIFHKFSQMAT